MRQWLGHNLSVDIGQGDKRQATASGTCKKMHDTKVGNTSDGGLLQGEGVFGIQDKGLGSCRKKFTGRSPAHRR
jgi:hypothetical protein